MNLILSVLAGRYAICRLGANEAIPDWAQPALSPGDAFPAWAPLSNGRPGSDGRFISITRTGDELSIVCPGSFVPEAVRHDRGWRCLKVEGPLDLSLTGILAALLAPLAEARVNIFAVSTFDTDYLLVKDELLSLAAETLVRAGHRIEAR
ncbi:MAG: hypothetical protein A2W03_09430 [Candidatus Aminicenantes bacterium RBG_16_63_16]|nr:MAG: hypothetical protein A2W03_09430 [Candidatus Aminicenantes bacterium RBG_16_63_16]